MCRRFTEGRRNVISPHLLWSRHQRSICSGDAADAFQPLRLRLRLSEQIASADQWRRHEIAQLDKTPPPCARVHTHTHSRRIDSNYKPISFGPRCRSEVNILGFHLTALPRRFRGERSEGEAERRPRRREKSKRAGSKWVTEREARTEIKGARWSDKEEAAGGNEKELGRKVSSRGRENGTGATDQSQPPKIPAPPTSRCPLDFMSSTVDVTTGSAAELSGSHLSALISDQLSHRNA